jgi:YbbR domain-containing protein
MVTAEVAEVHLDVKIQRWKEIPLKLELKYGGGALENNTSVKIDPVSIRVCGSELLLEDLNEIVLGTVDLSTLEENLTQTYTITMPEGVTNMTGKTEATVTIQFVGLTIREFEVSQIEVINVPEGLDYDLLNEVVKVRLRGAISLINQLNPEDIVLTVDLSGKEIGSFTIKPAITFKGDQYVTLGAVGPHSVSIAVKELDPEATE